MIATDFTRDGCKLSKAIVTYRHLQREFRCNEQGCGGRLVQKWTAMCESYPEGWHVECGFCGSHDFVHEVELQRQKQEAREVLDGLPPELAAMLK